jgi:hypothetical protein
MMAELCGLVVGFHRRNLVNLSLPHPLTKTSGADSDEACWRNDERHALRVGEPSNRSPPVTSRRSEKPLGTDPIWLPTASS